MAVSLDSRIPLAAVYDGPNWAERQRTAQELELRLAELKAARAADVLARRQRAGKSAYEQLQGIRQGQPAVMEPEPMLPGPVLNQPAFGAMREKTPAIPGREPSAEDYQRSVADALFREGDYEGAFEAVKQMRTAGPAMKSFGAETRTGEDGMEYAFNQATGRFEPTGFKSAREPVKPRVQTVRTARAPRPKVVSDDTGTFVIDLYNPSAPGVPVTKPGGAPITKPKANQEPTIDEVKNSGFYLRMKGVAKSLDAFEKTGAPTVMTSMAESLPFIGGYAQRKAMTKDQQQYYTAAMAWIRAKLRKESGAVIGEEEARSEWATYFPMPGDTKENIEQKKQLRKLAEDEMRLSAGRAAGKVDKAGDDRPRAVDSAVQWLKSRNIQNQQQFNAEIRALRKQGWTEAEIRQATQEAGL